MLMGISNDIGNPTQLSEGQKGLFNTLGASLAPMPAVNPDDPASLRAAAAEAMRRGDAQQARIYAVMASERENSVRQKNASQNALLDEGNAEIQAELARKQGLLGAKQAAGAYENFLTAPGLLQAVKRGDISVPDAMKAQQTINAEAQKQARMDAREAFKEQGRNARAATGVAGKTKIIEQVDEQGNTRNVLVDEMGAPIRDLGIKKPALSKKDEMKAKENEAKAAKKLAGYEASAKNVQDRVAEALDLVRNGTLTTGIGAQITGWVGGSPAKNLEAKLTTIKANLGFDRLQEMRDASPTGGALGQVAIQELVALQAAVDSLDQAQSGAQLEKALGVIDQHYNRWLATLRGEIPGGGGEVVDFSSLPE